MARKGTRKRIMVFGDSNTSRPDCGTMRWTDLLMEKDPIQLDVINEGCDGRTIKHDSGELNGLSVIENKLVTHAPLNYVIVMLGTNDVKMKYGPPRAADIAVSMGKIMDIIKVFGRGAEPIIITPPPVGNLNTGDFVNAQRRIRCIAEEYRLFAMKNVIRIVDINKILHINSDIDPDRVHLNGAGRQKVAEVVWMELQNVITRVI